MHWIYLVVALVAACAMVYFDSHRSDEELRALPILSCLALQLTMWYFMLDGKPFITKGLFAVVATLLMSTVAKLILRVHNFSTP